MSPPFENFTFSSRVWNLLLNTESGSLLFDERRTKRRTKREFYRVCFLSLDRSRINFTRSGKECVVVVSSHRAGEINRREIESHREREREREKDAHTHIISHHGDKSPAHNDAADQPHLPFPANEKQSPNLAVRTRRERRRVGRANRRFRRVHESRLGRLRGGETRERRETKDERRQSFVERRFGHHDG